MATVNVYVKRKLRLDMLSVPQRQMYDLGVVGLDAMKRRTANAYGIDDRPAAPLKPKWKNIKKYKGLKTVRDLRGTGMMWPENRKAGKRKARLKFVGHLMDQLLVRRVGDNEVHIPEPGSRYGRMKARNKRNRAMLGFSPADRQIIMRRFRGVIRSMAQKLIRPMAA